MGGKTSWRNVAAFYFAALVWLVLPLSAQNGDPPGRVARLSFISGSVSFEPSGEDTWSLASLNYPVTSGDRLWTDEGARAELEAGNLAVRMSEQTDLTATTLRSVSPVGTGPGDGTNQGLSAPSWQRSGSRYFGRRDRNPGAGRLSN